MLIAALGWRHTEDHHRPALAEQPDAVSIASGTPVALTATSKRAPSSALASVTAWAAPSLRGDLQLLADPIQDGNRPALWQAAVSH